MSIILLLQHEDLSVSILKKLMSESDNMNVLAEFVSSREGLGLNDLKLIELMIQPPKRGKTLPEPWAKREFLCEVSQLMHALHMTLIIIIMTLL